MTCIFENNCEAAEVLVQHLYHDEKMGQYHLYVLGKEDSGYNFVNKGSITLTEEEMHKVLQSGSLTSPESLIASRMQVVSNQLCKKAGINHLNHILLPGEWKRICKVMQESKEEPVQKAQLLKETLEAEDGEEL